MTQMLSREYAKDLVNDLDIPTEFAEEIMERAFTKLEAMKDAYVTMLADNPDLREFDNPKQMHQFFIDLWEFRSFYARNPTILATLMRQMMSSPATAGNVILSLRTKGGV